MKGLIYPLNSIPNHERSLNVYLNNVEVSSELRTEKTAALASTVLQRLRTFKKGHY